MEFTWIIIGVGVVLFLIFIFKSQDFIHVLGFFKDNIFYILILAIALFFAFSVVHIHNTYHTNLTTPKGIFQTGRLFFVWLGGVFDNVKGISGYASHQAWFNATNSTIK